MPKLVRVLVSVIVVASIVAACGQAAATPNPSVVASPAAAPWLPGAIPDLAAGTYALDTKVPMTIAVPAGWATCCGGAIVKNDFAGLLYWDDAQGITVYADPCRWSSGGGSNPVGAGAIAAALAAQKHREASPPRQVTVAGLPAFVVRLKVPLDQPTTRNADDEVLFTGCDFNQFRSYIVGRDGERYHQAPGQIDDFYIFEARGTTVIFDLVSGPGIPASDMAELEAMVASIRIE